ncbi:hypothetical protein DVH05_014713 [Phytophthora capsici]|nr:hypothetical protein DVH05_014713 [Phytophthora capsici]
MSYTLAGAPVCEADHMAAPLKEVDRAGTGRMRTLSLILKLASQVTKQPTTMAFLRTSIAIAATSAALFTAAPAQTMLGGWTEATVTETEVNLLVQATGDANNYAPDVTTAICLIAIEGLWTQVVAGTNYKYQVAGCPVNDASGLGACVDRECAKSDYDVVVFSQPWTNTVQVTSVAQHS